MAQSVTAGQSSDWWEQLCYGNFRYWHVIFLALSAFLTLLTMLCCCIRIRVPRTKQEIEADYQRKILTRKFHQELRKIQNSQMDAMDLKTALDLIRADFIAENESDKSHHRNGSIVSSISSQMQLMADEFLLKHANNQKLLEYNRNNPRRLSGRLAAAFRFSGNSSITDTGNTS